MRDQSIVIIGLGQLGRVFAGGFLRSGCPVVPVNRGDDMKNIAARVPDPALVLVAVAEPDLHPTLAGLPAAWRDRVGLIQNELLPRDWEAHQIAHPTVASVWFEKKKGTDAKPLIPTPVHGPQAELVCAALSAIDIPARSVDSADELLYELVRKNVYILTTNIAGIQAGGNVGELWAKHQMLATEVANEVMDIQGWLTGRKHDRKQLLDGMLEAIQADPAHGCRGRSAPDRLKRNLEFATQAGLEVCKLREIAAAVFA
jgi:ketopantoate reductase